MNERGYYGRREGPLLGQEIPRSMTVYVERESSSTGTWLLGTVAVVGALLWARHQSQQIEQLYKASGLPHQSFTGSLQQSARALPARARETFRGIAGRARGRVPKAHIEQPQTSTSETV